MHKCDTKTEKRSPILNSCAILRMSKNYTNPIAWAMCRSTVTPVHVTYRNSGYDWVKDNMNWYRVEKNKIKCVSTIAYMQPYQSPEEKREGGRVSTATFFFFYFFLCYSLISEITADKLGLRGHSDTDLSDRLLILHQTRTQLTPGTNSQSGMPTVSWVREEKYC